MSVIFTRAPLRISLGGGGTDLPSYYARARRLPGLRRDRQVRLHADPHGLPAPLPDEVLRRPRRSTTRARSAPDPARDAAAPLARQPAGDRLGRRRAGRHRHGLLGAFTVCLLKALAHARRVVDHARARWPRPPARSRSTSSRSRSASRTSTSPPTAASAPTRSTPTAASRSSRSSSRRRRCASCATTCCCSTRARRARAASVLARPGRALRAPATTEMLREPAPHEGDRAAAAATCSGRRPRRLRRADARALGEQAPPLPGHGDRAHRQPLHAGPPQRRDRRQARRRRRRRLPARLRASARGHPAGDGGGGAPELSSTSSSAGRYASEHA